VGEKKLYSTCVCSIIFIYLKNYFLKGANETKQFKLTSFSQGYLHMQTHLLGIISVDSEISDKLLIIYSAFVIYLRKNVNIMRLCISYLQTSKKTPIQIGVRFCVIFSLTLIPLYK